MMAKGWKTCGGEPEDEEVSFQELFKEFDTDKNGSLDEKEAFVLFKRWESTKKENQHLKQRIVLILTVASLIIGLLAAAVFGAAYAAAIAIKDTKVDSEGMLLPINGNQAVSTTSLGAVYKVTNSSDDAPVCLTDDDAAAIIHDILEGKRVLMDIVAEGTGATAVKELKSSGAEIEPEKKMCFHEPGGTEYCFEKGKCASGFDKHGRKLLDSGWALVGAST